MGSLDIPMNFVWNFVTSMHFLRKLNGFTDEFHWVSREVSLDFQADFSEFPNELHHFSYPEKLQWISFGFQRTPLVISVDFLRDFNGSP